MTTYVLAPQPRFGLSGTTSYKVYTYDSGGLVAATTWSDNGSTPNANPVVLVAGVSTIYIIAGKSYRFIYKTDADVTVWDADPVAQADPAASSSIGTSGTDLTLSGDLSVGDDATITDDLTVGGDVTVTGNDTVTGYIIGNGIKVTTPPPGFRNGIIEAAAAANAITITFETPASATPSTTDPVSAAHRSATITSGVQTTRAQTAALSTVISSGSTLGCASSEAVRIHIGLILNAGSAMELCYWTAQVAASVGIKRYDPTALVTTTAEGGAGAADSAQTVYSTTARTSQPMVYVGYIEATSGATAGQWSSVDKVVNWEPGVPLPGDLVGSTTVKSSGVATGTTNTDFDDTIPAITQGDQYLGLPAYTPKAIMNRRKIQICVAMFGVSVDDDLVTMALHRTGTTDAIRAVTKRVEYVTAQAPDSAQLLDEGQFESASAITYVMRAGVNEGDAQARTVTFNGDAGARRYGGVAGSIMTLEEFHG